MARFRRMPGGGGRPSRSPPAELSHVERPSAHRRGFMHSIRAALLASTVVLGACTTDLRTRPLPASGEQQVPAGFVYHLPAAVVTPSASISIDGCTPDPEGTRILGAALLHVD